MTEPLLSLPELTEFRDRDPARMLDAAGQAVRSYCGWHIAPEVTETVTVEGLGAALLLPTLRLTEVASITSATGTAVPLDMIRWKPNGVVTGYAFAGDYEVAFTHGYVTTPDDVAQAVASIASEGIDGVRRLKSWNKGPFSESYDSAAFDADRQILDRYRIAARP